MRRLGISIYPEKSTLAEIKSYLKKTSEFGFSRIFSCLLSVNKPAEEIKEELEELACDYFFNQNGYDTADYYDFEFVD